MPLVVVSKPHCAWMTDIVVMAEGGRSSDRY